MLLTCDDVTSFLFINYITTMYYICLNYHFYYYFKSGKKEKFQSCDVNLCECDDDDEQSERCFGIVKWVRVVGEYHAICVMY